MYTACPVPSCSGIVCTQLHSLRVVPCVTAWLHAHIFDWRLIWVADDARNNITRDAVAKGPDYLDGEICVMFWHTFLVRPFTGSLLCCCIDAWSPGRLLCIADSWRCGVHDGLWLLPQLNSWLSTYRIMC